MLRFGWVLALALCSCAITRDTLGKLPAAGEAGKASGGAGAAAGSAAHGGGGEAAAGESGAGAGGSSGSGGQAAGAPAAGASGGKCDASQCDGTGSSLDGYCKLEHANCPISIESALAGSCTNTFLNGRQRFPNACGGMTARLRYAFGNVEFYYDRTGKLITVITVTDSKAGPCDASFYLYGDQTCAPAGKEEEFVCP